MAREGGGESARSDGDITAATALGPKMPLRERHLKARIRTQNDQQPMCACQIRRWTYTIAHPRASYFVNPAMLVLRDSQSYPSVPTKTHPIITSCLMFQPFFSLFDPALPFAMVLTSLRVGSLLFALCLCVTFVSVSADIPITPTPYVWETRWWQAQVDNFNFGTTGQTFPLKYLIAEQYYKTGGPIFFYTGNEGPIELFAENTGFMWDIAPQFNALIVFAEHRYYGDSLPYGADSFTNVNYQHLSAEQALGDYALLLNSLKFNMSIPNAQIITFGGSYGGMLSSWFRKNYPHIVAGAIAGSAPIWMFDTLEKDFDPGTYNRIVSNDFRAVSQGCFDNIAASWNAMTEMAKTPAGLKQLSNELGLCTELTSVDDVENQIFTWMQNVYSSMPMGGQKNKNNTRDTGGQRC